MTDDYIALITTINCIGTLSNMGINSQMLDKARHDRTEELLGLILSELRELNRRLEDGLRQVHDEDGQR